MTKIKSLILTVFIAVFALPMAAMAQPDDKLDSASSFDMQKLMNRAISGNLNDQTTAKQAIIMDYDTGMVLMEKDADARMPTASNDGAASAIAVVTASAHTVRSAASPGSDTPAPSR